MADFVVLAVLGGVAGVMAGLLGIGGGALIVPVLVIVFEAQGENPDIVMQLALGTSLATIVFTAVSSTLAHHRRGAVDWRIFRSMAPGVVLGTVAGAWIAEWLSTQTLKIIFVLFMMGIAIQFSLGKTGTGPHASGLPGRLGMSVSGAIIGVASALFGIGGGSLSVPFMTWCGVAVKRAVATAAAIGLPIALSGAGGFIWTGWNVPDRPAMSVGYVVLPAFAGIVAASMLAAPIGARLAHRLAEVVLRRIFALFVFLLGLRMLYGLFPLA